MNVKVTSELKLQKLLERYSVNNTVAIHQFYLDYTKPCYALLYNYATKYWDDTYVPFEEVVKMAEKLKYTILINKH